MVRLVPLTFLALLLGTSAASLAESPVLGVEISLAGAPVNAEAELRGEFSPPYDVRLRRLGTLRLSAVLEDSPGARVRVFIEYSEGSALVVIVDEARDRIVVRRFVQSEPQLLDAQIFHALHSAFRAIEEGISIGGSRADGLAELRAIITPPEPDAPPPSPTEHVVEPVEAVPRFSIWLSYGLTLRGARVPTHGPRLGGSLHFGPRRILRWQLEAGYGFGAAFEDSVVSGRFDEFSLRTSLGPQWRVFGLRGGAGVRVLIPFVNPGDGFTATSRAVAEPFVTASARLQLGDWSRFALALDIGADVPLLRSRWVGDDQSIYEEWLVQPYLALTFLFR